MMQYDLQYGDLLTFCPQWLDIFVDQSLAFRSLTPAPRILDCGANIGLASLYFKRLYPHASITAFEADPAIAGQLARNLRVNGTDVEVVAAAVWTRTGDVTFAADRADSGSLVNTETGPSRTSIRVPSVRLADIVAREPISLLKLDIEGAEAEVLRDIAPYLGNVDALLLEVHEFRPESRRLPELLQLLGAAGMRYSVSHVTPLPDLDAPEDRRRSPFPQSANAWVAAVCAWRTDAR